MRQRRSTVSHLEANFTLERKFMMTADEAQPGSQVDRPGTIKILNRHTTNIRRISPTLIVLVIGVGYWGAMTEQWPRLQKLPNTDNFSDGLWADFGSRIAISDKMIRVDRLYEDLSLLDSPSLKMRKSAHKPFFLLLDAILCRKSMP